MGVGLEPRAREPGRNTAGASPILAARRQKQTVRGEAQQWHGYSATQIQTVARFLPSLQNPLTLIFTGVCRTGAWLSPENGFLESMYAVIFPYWQEVSGFPIDIDVLSFLPLEVMSYNPQPVAQPE